MIAFSVFSNSLLINSVAEADKENVIESHAEKRVRHETSSEAFQQVVLSILEKMVKETLRKILRLLCDINERLTRLF